MPATFRSLRVETNIEAGLKYLSQMIRRFAREDYALAGYNGGPGRVSRGRPPLESLQYVLAVGQYRNVLKLYDRSVRHHAQRIGLEEIRLVAVCAPGWSRLANTSDAFHPAQRLSHQVDY